MTADKPTTPSGRDEVVDALVRHATLLFSARGLDQVSVREIAAAAGVNHSLVFRHFGSKVGLLGAVLDHLRHRFAEVGETGASRQAINDELRLYAVILARILLDGQTEVLQTQQHPVVDWLRRALADADLTEERAAQLVATTLALALGGELYLPAIAVAVGLTPEHTARLLADSTVTVTELLRDRWSGGR